MKKNVFSVILALVMCLAILPTTTHAAEPGAIAEVTAYVGDGVETISVMPEMDGQSGVEALFEALANESSGVKMTKIKLLDDVTFSVNESEPMFMNLPNLTLDLNGKTMTSYTPVVVNTDLTITDTSATKKGKLTSMMMVVLRSENTNSTNLLTLSAGILDVSGFGSGMHGLMITDYGEVRISGGEVWGAVFVGTETDVPAYGGELTMTGGKIGRAGKDDDGLMVCNGMAEISGGEITNLVATPFGGVVLSGGKISDFVILGFESNFFTRFLNNGYAYYDQKSGKVVNAFTAAEEFESDESTEGEETTEAPALYDYYLGNLEVKAHSCTFDSEDKCACGRTKPRESGNTNTAVAKIIDLMGDVQYAQDNEEFSNILNGSSVQVTLLDDVELNLIRCSYDTTIDLNGHSISFIDGFKVNYGGSLTFTDSSKKQDGQAIFEYLWIEEGSSITVKGGTLKTVTMNDNPNMIKGELIVDGGTVDCDYLDLIVFGGKITVNSGTLDCTGADIYLSPKEEAEVTSLALDDEEKTAKPNAKDTGDTMLVSGGEVKGIVYVNGGTSLNVQGGKLTNPEMIVTYSTDLMATNVEIDGGIVTVSDGEIEALCLHKNGKATLTGGKFGHVYVEQHEGKGHVNDCLPDGYAYYDSSNKLCTFEKFNFNDDKDFSHVTNAAVKAHQCEFEKQDGVWTCGCGRTMEGAQTPVAYLDESGMTRYCANYTVIDEDYIRKNTHHDELYWANVDTTDDIWLLVDGNVKIDTPVAISQYRNVRLILADDSHLQLAKDLSGYNDNSLTIYAQSTGSKMGKLTVQDGLSIENNLNIHGGKISVTTEKNNLPESYAIYCGNNMTVTGGEVTAKDGGTTYNSENDGISFGVYVAKNLYVSGGKLTAESGSAYTTVGIYVGNEDGDGYSGSSKMVVRGGEVKAIAADVTADDFASSIGLAVGALEISDGTLTATAGNVSSKGWANTAGIYSYLNDDSEIAVNVSGGKLIATAGNVNVTADKNTRIYGDSEGIRASTLLVTGGEVTTTGGNVVGKRTAAYNGEYSDGGESFGLSVAGAAISDGTFTAKSGKITMPNDSEEGNEWSSMSNPVWAVHFNVSGGEITLNNAMKPQFVKDEEDGLYWPVNSDLNLGSLDMTGGTFNGTVSVLTTDRTQIYGGEIALGSSWLTDFDIEYDMEFIDLPAKGYAYWQIGEGENEGAFFVPREGISELNYAIIRPCTHSYTNGKCVWCGNSKSSGGGGGSSASVDNTKKDDTKTENNENKTDNSGNTNRTFTDVADNAYYADAVKWALDKGITTGATKTEFAPNKTCTRAEIVTFLWRAAGMPDVELTIDFIDVDKNAYYAKAVAWAVQQGITNGMGEGIFAPNAVCTRAEAVTFLWRAAGKLEVAGSAAFSDVSPDDWFAAAVKWAEENGITGGIGDGLFGAADECTRAQIVAFLFRSAE